MGFESANIYFKVSAGLSLLALIIQVVGFATPEWSVTGAGRQRATVGLWETCGEGLCVSNSRGNFPPKFHSAQAMGTIGLILVLAAVVGSVLTVFVDSFRPKANLVGVCALLACITIILCVILLGTIFVSPFKAGYSLGLSVVGGILSLAKACLMFFGHRRNVT